MNNAPKVSACLLQVFSLKSIAHLTLVSFVVFDIASLRGASLASAQEMKEPDWSENAPVPQTGRRNPYQWTESTLKKKVHAGQLHAVDYPVKTSEMLIPYEPMQKLLSGKHENPLRRFLSQLYRGFTRLQGMDDVYAWLGLHEFPPESEKGIYAIPYPGGKRPEYRMGTSFIETENGKGLTFSCATCHSSELFGKKIFGLQNRFAKPFHFFSMGEKAVPLIDPYAFQFATGATDGERAMFEETRTAVKSTQTKVPQVVGMDASLAQIGLSLARRERDPYATKSEAAARHPRPSWFRNNIAESKPGVWWNVKYKNRWLLDGSMVSGHPIYTNILWNEIGRGADLEVLETWLNQNGPIIEEITAAVFATEAPPYTDFFPASSVNLKSAKNGEILFKNHCAHCHGTYEKAWNLADASKLNSIEILKTVEVRYHENTPVLNVGTDPGRAEGMHHLAPELNRLAISQNLGVVVKPQKGYVPPPLVGIWARWPYFHNNSAPSLCAVLTQSNLRPQFYYAGPAKNPSTDFDAHCNGYPSADKVPAQWKKNRSTFYDTRREGMGNQGHDEGIFLMNGVEIFSNEEKNDIITFLKTL
jgi:cytochrome c2